MAPLGDLHHGATIAMRIAIGGDGRWPSGRFTDGKSNVQTRRVRLRADLIYDDTLTHQCRCGAGHLTEEEFSTLKESLLKGGLDPVRILAGRRC
jgi:hypothetical protein